MVVSIRGDLLVEDALGGRRDPGIREDGDPRLALGERPEQVRDPAQLRRAGRVAATLVCGREALVLERARPYPVEHLPGSPGMDLAFLLCGQCSAALARYGE